jgi:hypothetical protein
MNFSERRTRHRVLVLVNEILIGILLDYFLGLIGKVGVDERSKTGWPDQKRTAGDLGVPHFRRGEPSRDNSS